MNTFLCLIDKNTEYLNFTGIAWSPFHNIINMLLVLRHNFTKNSTVRSCSNVQQLNKTLKQHLLIPFGTCDPSNTCGQCTAI